MSPVKKKEEIKEPPRTRIIEAITAPLGFFVLALLIVETFLGTVLLGADLEKSQKMIGLWAGVGMFVLVVIIVALLVWHKPQNLTFDKTAHLINRGKIPWGTNQSHIPPGKFFSEEEKVKTPKESKP